MKQFRRNSIFLLSLTLAISSLMGTSAQAANSGYRYWGYFQAAPNAKVWSEAMTGPTVVMADGAVEGWAFTFSGDKVPDAASPRVLPTFAKICGSTKAAGANSKRVGIVIDFGRAALRPEGESTPRSLFKCVVVDKNAIGFDVLAKVVKVRTSASGFVCAFNSYPAKECGAAVPTPTSLIVKN